jgi:hypothetical protein
MIIVYGFGANPVQTINVCIEAFIASTLHFKSAAKPTIFLELQGASLVALSA